MAGRILSPEEFDAMPDTPVGGRVLSMEEFDAMPDDSFTPSPTSSQSVMSRVGGLVDSVRKFDVGNFALNTLPSMAGRAVDTAIDYGTDLAGESQRRIMGMGAPVAGPMDVRPPSTAITDPMARAVRGAVQPVADRLGAVVDAPLKAMIPNYTPQAPKLVESLPTNEFIDPARTGGMVGQLAEGAGQLAYQAGEFAAVGPGRLAAAGLNFAGGAGRGFQAAQSQQADPLATGTAMLAHGGLGLTEMLPIASAFDRVNGALGGKLTQKAVALVGQRGAAGLSQAAEEGLQEVAQTYGENVANDLILNIKQNWGAGAAESGAVGGILGLIMGVMTPGRARVDVEQENNQNATDLGTEMPTQPTAPPVQLAQQPPLARIPQPQVQPEPIQAGNIPIPPQTQLGVAEQPVIPDPVQPQPPVEVAPQRPQERLNPIVIPPAIQEQVRQNVPVAPVVDRVEKIVDAQPDVVQTTQVPPTDVPNIPPLNAPATSRESAREAAPIPEQQPVIQESQITEPARSAIEAMKARPAKEAEPAKPVVQPQQPTLKNIGAAAKRFSKQRRAKISLPQGTSKAQFFRDNPGIDAFTRAAFVDYVPPDGGDQGEFVGGGSEKTVSMEEFGQHLVEDLGFNVTGQVGQNPTEDQTLDFIAGGGLKTKTPGRIDAEIASGSVESGYYKEAIDEGYKFRGFKDFSEFRESSTGIKPGEYELKASDLKDGERVTIQGENFVVQPEEGDNRRLVREPVAGGKVEGKPASIVLGADEWLALDREPSAPPREPLRDAEESDATQIKGKDVYSTKHEVVKSAASEVLRDKMESKTKESDRQWMDDSIKTGSWESAPSTAKKILDGDLSVLSARQEVDMRLFMGVRDKEIADKRSKLKNPISEDERAQIVGEIEELENELDDVMLATFRAGSEWGRSGVARRIEKSLADMPLVEIKARKRAKERKSQLTEKEKVDAEQIFTEGQELKKKTEEKTAERDDAEAGAQIEVWTRGAKRTKAENVNMEINAAREKLMKQLKGDCIIRNG